MSERNRKTIASSSSSSKGKSLSSSSYAPSQYVMDLVFTLVTRSRSRNTDTQPVYPIESSTPPPRPSANLVRSSDGLVQLRPTTPPSSNQGSSIPSLSTFSQAVGSKKKFVPRPKIKTYFKKTQLHPMNEAELTVQGNFMNDLITVNYNFPEILKKEVCIFLSEEFPEDHICNNCKLPSPTASTTAKEDETEEKPEALKRVAKGAKKSSKGPCVGKLCKKVSCDISLPTQGPFELFFAPLATLFSASGFSSVWEFFTEEDAYFFFQDFWKIVVNCNEVVHEVSLDCELCFIHWV
ncbi:unnamed protein product [Citrullus colocynthis]|uniref:Uncharacterized protein n=1 Tax=Citrullus colocynthis TaxID=252529 RepID=A0ABP0YTA1_9ROSI